MLRSWHIVAAVAVWGAPAIALAQSGLSAETLKKLKAATVLVEIETEEEGGSGSGFVLEKLPADEQAPQGSVLVVTNAHVVDPQGASRVKITCVFHSGSRQEVSYPARRLAVDEDRDLAILKVDGADLPEPLDVATEVDVHETLPVFVLGFPFGELLATSRRRPAITISKGTVSSIRRDDWNRIALIQVDNGINPGNSGGPVVTESGSLIGISVAKIRGADIGFAIPKSELEAMLQGRVAKVSLQPVLFSEKQAEYQFRVDVIDPKDNITKLEIWTAPRAQVSQPIAPGEDGRWRPVASDMQTFSLKRFRFGHHAGRVRILHPRKGEPYLFQVRYETKDGKTHFTAPAPFVLGVTGAGRVNTVEDSSRSTQQEGVAGNDAPRRGMPLRGDVPEEENGAVQVESFDATITRVVLGGGGRYLILHLGADDQAVVYDLRERKKVLTLSAPEEDVIVANQNTLFVLSRTERRFESWSLATMSRGRKGKLPIDGPVIAAAAGMASKGQILVAWAAQIGGSARVFYSLINPGSKKSTVLNPTPTRNRRVKSYQLPIRVNNAGHGIEMLMSSDGKTIALSRTRVSPTGAEIIRLRKDDRASLIYDHETYGHVMPTADGRWVCTGKGVFSADLVRSHSETPAVASTHPKFFMAVAKERGSFDICETATGKAVRTLPPLRELGDDLRALKQSRLAFYERFLLIPQYNCMVSIPLGDDRIAIRDVDLGVAAEADQDDGLRNITGEPYRTWKDRSGKYEVVARLVAIGPTEITIQRREGNRVKVSISRLSEKDVEYVRQFER